MKSASYLEGSEPVARERLRVFVVDDEAIISSTLATILQRSGFDAVSFTHSVAALEATCLQPPDLLLSDVVMPVLSGIDLAIQVREHWPTCKIILISGQSSTRDLLEKAEAQGHRFEILTKPMHPVELLKRIETVFEFAGNA